MEVGVEIKLTSALESCEQIFEPESLASLGEGPRCQIASDYSHLSIRLGSNARVDLDSQLQLINSSLMGLHCKYHFSQVDPSTFNKDILAAVPPPTFRFNELKNEFSLCEDIQILVVQEKFNGLRNLNYLQWSLVDHDDEND